jgi:coenzyme F420-reducing hydrogenase delta subunit
MRLTYPTNIKIIRVPCTGKVDVMYLLRCFQEGADGVYCVGCMEGNCHYNQGNLVPERRTHHQLDEIGIEGDRVRCTTCRRRTDVKIRPE